MKRFRPLSAGALALGLAVFACHSAPEPPVARPAPTPAAAARASEPRLPFVPPADGRLSARHVEMYRSVEQRAVELSPTPVAGAALDPAALTRIVQAEARAAEQLGQDPAEYRWVRDRVAEASPASTEALGGVGPILEQAVREGSGRLVRQQASRTAAAAAAAVRPDAAARDWNRKVVAQPR